MNGKKITTKLYSFKPKSTNPSFTFAKGNNESRDLKITKMNFEKK